MSKATVGWSSLCFPCSLLLLYFLSLSSVAYPLGGKLGLKEGGVSWAKYARWACVPTGPLGRVIQQSITWTGSTGADIKEWKQTLNTLFFLEAPPPCSFPPRVTPASIVAGLVGDTNSL
jgi:hypothetical protein